MPSIWKVVLEHPQCDRGILINGYGENPDEAKAEALEYFDRIQDLKKGWTGTVELGEPFPASPEALLSSSGPVDVGYGALGD